MTYLMIIILNIKVKEVNVYQSKNILGNQTIVKKTDN